ncbi:hypothetical protein TNCV_1085791 [Trichonephila clavipes]|nr:hypothetical protein TNCV_1085791 [Trichonephila clavipes]
MSFTDIFSEKLGILRYMTTVNLGKIALLCPVRHSHLGLCLPPCTIITVIVKMQLSVCEIVSHAHLLVTGHLLYEYLITVRRCTSVGLPPTISILTGEIDQRNPETVRGRSSEDRSGDALAREILEKHQDKQ